MRRAALGFLLVVALLAVPAYLTGEPAEEMVKNLQGLSRTSLEAHEEAAAVGFTGVILLGAISLSGLIWFRRGKPVPNWFITFLFAASLVVGGWMAWTAELGGQIRHPEIRSGTSAAERHHENHDD